MIEFYKYEGTGNDFILVDNRSRIFTDNKIEFAKRWCHRHFGVGSDGLIFIEKESGFDFLMDFYNPDGSQSFCGNGSRCAVQFAKYLEIIKGQSVSFKAIDGGHYAEVSDEAVRVKMKDSGKVEHVGNDHFIHTGSPHYISYETKGIRDIVSFGREIRYSDAYKPAGTNVNLVEEIGADHIRVRTYERGVEAETWSCGTGATACALSYAYKHDIAKGSILVDVRGGRLKVDFKNTGSGFTDIWLEGPARFVFKGMLA